MRGNKTKGLSLERHLVVDDLKEFEERAIRLTASLSSSSSSGYRQVDWVKMRLLRLIHEKKGLFDGERHVHRMARASQVMMEAYQLNLAQLPLFHLILTE